jgi:hypothetical protein
MIKIILIITFIFIIWCILYFGIQNKQILRIPFREAIFIKTPTVKGLSETMFIKTNNTEKLFEKVKEYRFGIDDKNINLNNAKKILNTIIQTGNEVDIAKSKMILQDINMEETKWVWPHKDNKNNLSKLGFKFNEKNVYQHSYNNIGSLDFIDENEIKMQEILLENLKNKHKNNNLNVFDKPKISNDKQNVHDHIVVRSVVQSLNNMNSTNNNDIENTNEFINFKNSLDNKTQLTLNKILSGTEKISSYNLSEYEIFNKVWNSILQNPHKNELLNILKLQLIDSNNVCTMGRANRIIQTLEGFDDKIVIKPEWAIVVEMNNIASKKFNELLNNVKYTNIMDSDDNNLITEFKNIYKINLLSEFNKYNNLLSTDYINAKINEYLQVF